LVSNVTLSALHGQHLVGRVQKYNLANQGLALEIIHALELHFMVQQKFQDGRAGCAA